MADAPAASEPTANALYVVAAILSRADGRILIAQRPPGKHLAGSWEFPGGKCEPGEEPLKALRRELREELGIDIGAGEPLIRVSHSYEDRAVIIDTWRVREWRGEPQGLEGQALRWCLPAELSKVDMLAADWPIVDALLKDD